MKYIDYVQLNPFQKFAYNFSQFIKKLPKSIANFFIAIGKAILGFFVGIGKGVANYFVRFVKGNIGVKLSYLIFGAGNILNGQIIKGIVFLLTEVAYVLYMLFFGWTYISKFGTLGDIPTSTYRDAMGYEVVVTGDHSMLILLYSVLTIVITAIFLVIYIANTKSAYNACETIRAGKKPIGFRAEMKQFTDEKFHITLLSLPCLLIGCFTILPMVFMILIAFTNYDHWHMPPGNLFTWVGFENFGDLVNIANGAKKAKTFLSLTQWTVIWAVFATFSNYILGMIVALMINKKGIKLKALWRTLFVVVVAVPQFVSLILMNQMLQTNGAFNQLLTLITGRPWHYDFLGTALSARITIIVVNIWVGIPYTILITSGILMNIPADLYESATIDGAGPVKSFMKITLPYMLFVTTPYLITNFIGNINNFNVIYLVTGGRPTNLNLDTGVGDTDLLVTWLFKLTVENQEKDYKLGATIGILVFIVCATLSLITFNITKSAKDEEAFS